MRVNEGQWVTMWSPNQDRGRAEGNPDESAFFLCGTASDEAPTDVVGAYGVIGFPVAGTSLQQTDRAKAKRLT